MTKDPERIARRAKAAAEAKGISGYRFTLQAPSYVPFMKYSEVRELRQQLYEAFFSVGGEEPHERRAADDALHLERKASEAGMTVERYLDQRRRERAKSRRARKAR